MNCAEAEELLGAYALDALPDDEAALFRSHLTTCAGHAAQALEMRAIASTLAMTTEPVPPPPALRARLLDAVARQPQDAPVTAAAAPRPIRAAPLSRVEERRIQWSPLRSLRPARVWGALAAAVIAGLLAWNIVLQSGGSEGERLAATRADAVATLFTAANHEPIGTVLYYADERKAVVVAEGIAQVNDSKTYQMWTISNGTPSSVGFLAPNAAGLATMIVPFDAARSDAFAVTIEPRGGSDKPTTDPVYTATITS